MFYESRIFHYLKNVLSVISLFTSKKKSKSTYFMCANSITFEIRKIIVAYFQNRLS